MWKTRVSPRKQIVKPLISGMNPAPKISAFKIHQGACRPVGQRSLVSWASIQKEVLGRYLGVSAKSWLQMGEIIPSSGLYIAVTLGSVVWVLIREGQRDKIVRKPP
jgi:hypothetical protein